MKRKTLIYRTGVEYGDYTLNHVQGCSHGCKYPCYAYMLAKRFGKVKNYEGWIKPLIVDNALELLDKEIPKYRDKINILHLCFTTDPFMCGHDDICDMSMKILNKANAAGIKCSVLSKAVLPIELADLPCENEMGITVVTLDERFREQYEPGAAPIADRIQALRALHERGCKTWVSIEPYPTPNMIQQDLTAILNAVNFTDKIIFGRLHYNKVVSEFKQHKQFYNECAHQVIKYCNEHGIQYHIKTGTLTEQEEK